MYKRLWILLVIWIGLVGPVRADWVPVTDTVPAQVRVQAVDVSATTTRLVITLPGFQHETVLVQGIPHSRLRLPGHVFTLTRGAPELPFVTARLVLPDQGSPRIKVVASRWRERPMAPVVPSKGNLPRTAAPTDVPWEFGPVYTSDGLYPADVTDLGTPYIVRDRRGVALRIYPLRWDVGRGVLRVLESLTLEVTTDGTGGVNEKQSRPHPVDRVFTPLYADVFDNDHVAAKYNLVPTAGRMLVVCHDSLLDAVGSFVQWKRACGLQVELVSTSSLGSTRDGIQAAINERYFAPAGLTYVILVGDVAQIPTYSGAFEGADDDTRYARVEGDDLYPDLFVSRISAETTDQVLVQTNKFIRYERDPDPDGQWYERALGGASFEAGDSDLKDYERAEFLRSDLLAYDFTHADRVYMPGGTTAELAAALNQGRSLLYYLGHGTGSSWSAPYFGLADVANLQNGWANPWVLDVSCSNGFFSQDECFAELWMRVGTPAVPQGAVAIFSASTVTPWVPPCVMQAEAIDLLVTDRARSIGALFQYGIMRVLDEYPGDDGRQLVEQYNIFGDCSLLVRTRRPVPVTVTHPSEMFVGQDFFNVQTGRPGATVALTSAGVLHGAAVADAIGLAEIHLDTPPTAPGIVDLTVGGVDVLTALATVQVVAPLTVTLDPATLVVGESTLLTVTVPATLAGYQVLVAGFGVPETPAGLMDSQGTASLLVTPLCGEILTVRIRAPGSPVDLLRQSLPVIGAQDLTHPVLTAVVPSAGVTGQLVPGLPGVVTGQADEELLMVRVVGGGVDATAGWNNTTLTATVLPLEPAQMTAALVKPGFNVFTARFSAEPVFTVLTGTVTDLDGGAGLVAARVRLYPVDQGPDTAPELEILTAGDGTFAAYSPLSVAPYDLEIVCYGYTTLTRPIVPGPDPLAVVLESAPTGSLVGIVRSDTDATAVQGLVELLRSDTGVTVAQAFTDPATGAFNFDGVPWFDYALRVTADHFLPLEISRTLAAEVDTVDLAPVPAAGRILILSDDLLPAGALNFPVKLDKAGQTLAPAHVQDRSSAGLDMIAPLFGWGYEAAYQPASASDPGTWPAYDLLIYSCGNSYDNLGPATRAALLDHVAQGGRLLLEGGEVAYAHRHDRDLAVEVLHLDRWYGDAAQYLSLADDPNVLQGYPQRIDGQMLVDNNSYGDVDEVLAAPDAATVGVWGMWDSAAMICFDNDPRPEGGQIVFLAFDYAALESGRRESVLRNAVHYLLQSPSATGSLGGTVEVVGGPDAAGVTVRLEPGGHMLVTGPDGVFALTNLVAGTYRLTATAPAASAVVKTVTLAEGEQVSGLELALRPTLVQDFCDAPALAIPDQDPQGASTVMTVGVGSRVSGLSVQVDVSHPHVEDLSLELISPMGTTVRLHHHQGGAADDLVGWYPAELTIWDDLDVFLGQETDGDWTLRAIDDAELDTGLLKAWCLRLEYEAIPADAPRDALPPVATLWGNHPNPFNPSTTIVFALPRPGSVDLSIYDISGRLVRTLLTGPQSAGHHQVLWDGRDNTGQATASGTYFTRLRFDRKTMVQKLLLLR